jgi:hypothetical protein
MNPMTSGRPEIYNAIDILRKVANRLPEGSKDRVEVETAIRKLYRGTYLNEEQLKAMYKLGYREGNPVGWLEDDSDDD